jgi:anti-sigma B factor antagonist
MSAKVRLRRRGDTALLEIVGGIRGKDTALVVEKLDGAVKAGAAVVAVDLTETTFVDSHGLGMFVYYWKMLAEKDRELVFVNPRGFMHAMFASTNLDRLFRVVSSLEDL